MPQKLAVWLKVGNAKSRLQTCQLSDKWNGVLKNSKALHLVNIEITSECATNNIILR